MRHEQIILHPLITERTAIAETSGKYTFKVSPRANKTEIKKAVEKIFNTKVEKVNIVNTQSKTRRRGKTIGEVSGFKKAIVTLEKGQKIKIREEKKASGPTGADARREKKEKKTEVKAEKEKKVKEKNKTSL